MPATVYDIDLNGTTLHQVTNTSHDDGRNIVNDGGSGEASPGALFGGNFNEITTITSTDIETLVGLTAGAFVNSGHCISAGTVEVPYRVRANCATFEGGMSHPALAGTDGLLVPTRFEASQDNDDSATGVSALHWKSSDGLTPGATASTGNTLTAATFQGSFAMGKAFIGGTELPELQSIAVIPGITVTEQREGGGKYPVAHFITEILPTMEFTFENMVAAVGFLGALQAGAGGVVAYFRKRQPGGVYVPDATLEHISFSLVDANTLVGVGGIEASENDNGTATLTANGLALTAATGVAIP